MAKVGAISRLPYNQAGVNLYTSEAGVPRDAFFRARRAPFGFRLRFYP